MFRAVTGPYGHRSTEVLKARFRVAGPFDLVSSAFIGNYIKAVIYL